ncbi:MAG: hypothetical protein M1812_004614 [Candelaria pacifica]|nr:MAG: hypothetical protein M1812_004614 [Candelaria pacifica]
MDTKSLTEKSSGITLAEEGECQETPTPPTMSPWRFKSSLWHCRPCGIRNRLQHHQALKQAKRNCKQTTAMIRILESLLKKLMVARHNHLSDMRAPEDSGDVWVLECLLHHYQKDTCLETSQAFIGLLQRACSIVCNQNQDDLADIQTKHKHMTDRFIQRWGELHLHASGLIGHLPSDTELKYEGRKNLVSDALDFYLCWKKHMANRPTVRIRGRDTLKSIRSMGDVEKWDLLSRCEKNRQYVHNTLVALGVELIDEQERRLRCGDPSTTQHYKGSTLCLVRAIAHVDRILGNLDKIEYVAFGTQKHHVKEISRFVSLYRTDWQWGLMLKADDIAERIDKGTWLDEWGWRADGDQSFSDGK